MTKSGLLDSEGVESRDGLGDKRTEQPAQMLQHLAKFVYCFGNFRMNREGYHYSRHIDDMRERGACVPLSSVPENPARL